MTEVVAALIWNGNKFLACQRPANKARGLLWEFVGGKVEQGETKEAALIRECREELGITVAVGAVFMEVVHEYPDLTVHLTLFHAKIARKGLGNEAFPDRNPQRGLCPLEENCAFQGLPMERISLFFCSNKLKTCFQLISTAVPPV